MFSELISLETYNTFLWIMAAVAVVVFVALYFVEAGYGYLFNPKFGFPVPNKVAWVLMECPVFFAMAALWWLSPVRFEAAPLVLFAVFQMHYFQRSFIFPLLTKEFRTASGRIVRDGGGITPDIDIDIPQYSRLVYSLVLGG
ncbi:MAG: hypothetical protein IIV76_04160, partial [Alistipes sp.]|nr:hypothetical protein [Alistipes sp.]